MRTVSMVSILLVLVTACGNQRAGEEAAGPRIPETPSPTTAPCPESGVRVLLGASDGASGLRVLNLQMVNCGDVPQRFDGYPQLKLYDAEGRPVKVTVHRGTGGIADIEPFKKPPSAFTLKPGDVASAGILWRNLVQDTTRPATTADIAAVTPRPGMRAQRVTDATIDLGNTEKIGVSPWTKFRTAPKDVTGDIPSDVATGDAPHLR